MKMAFHRDGLASLFEYFFYFFCVRIIATFF